MISRKYYYDMIITSTPQQVKIKNKKDLQFILKCAFEDLEYDVIKKLLECKVRYDTPLYFHFKTEKDETTGEKVLVEPDSLVDKKLKIILLLKENGYTYNVPSYLKNRINMSTNSFYSTLCWKFILAAVVLTSSIKLIF